MRIRVVPQWKIHFFNIQPLLCAGGATAYALYHIYCFLKYYISFVRNSRTGWINNLVEWSIEEMNEEEKNDISLCWYYIIDLKLKLLLFDLIV